MYMFRIHIPIDIYIYNIITYTCNNFSWRTIQYNYVKSNFYPNVIIPFFL